MVEVIGVMIWVLESIDIKRAVSRRFEAALRTVYIIEFGVFPLLGSIWVLFIWDENPILSRHNSC